MVEEDEVVVLESVGGVDEDIRELNENLTINLLDVDNVHL
jgi:ATP-dependent 26S proteasome regulatory subunit